MYKTVRLLAILIACVILMTGCRKDMATDPFGDNTSFHPAETLSPLPSASPLEIVHQVLHADLTQEEAERQWGTAADKVEGSTYYGELAPTDIWRYDYASAAYTVEKKYDGRMIDFTGLTAGKVNAQLLLNWSKQGKLLYAAYYYHDNDGKLRSYLPAFGVLPATPKQIDPLVEANRLQPGQTVQMHQPTYAYDLISSKLQKPVFATKPGKSYLLNAVSGQFAELDDQGMRGWVPVWYLTEQADQMETIPPVKLAVTKEEPVYWYPDTSANTVFQMKPGQMAYAFQQEGDWYGVVPLPEVGSDPIGTVWVKKDRFQSLGALAPIYADSPTASTEAAAAAMTLFHQVTTQERARAVFGERYFIETSENVMQTGMPMKTLTQWRYENDFSQLLITWSDDSTLLRYDLTKRDHSAFPTKNQPFEWRLSTELAYNYLISATDDFLLVAGEDGGFSGMHAASEMYAVSKQTGERLWQYTSGPNAFRFVLAADRTQAIFLSTDGTKSTESQSLYQMKALNITTGKQNWNQEILIKGHLWDIQMSGAADRVAVSYTIGDDMTQKTFLEAFDTHTGKSVWKKQLDQQGKLVERPLSGSVLLVQTGGDPLLLSGLTAYNPNTGKKVWRIGERKAIDMYETPFVEDIRPFSGANPDAVWTQSVDELIQIDLANGKTIKRFPVSPMIRYIAVNERYAFELKANDGLRIQESKSVTSTLLDLNTRQALWAVHGAVRAGIQDSGTLYYSLEGKLTAAGLADGKTRWETALPSVGAVVMFNGKLVVESASNILTLDPESGKVLYRMSNVMTGYYDITPPLQVNGTLTVMDGKLYLGSMNGFFSKIGTLGPNAN